MSEKMFPSRPILSPAFSTGVQLARTRLTGTGPGEATQMNVYLPQGEHADRSIGCVLAAPAGKTFWLATHWMAKIITMRHCHMPRPDF